MKMEQKFEEEVVAEESVVVTKRGRKPKLDDDVSPELAQASVDSDYVKPSTGKHKYEVSASDLIGTLFTYASSPLKKGNFKREGKCLLCGTGTAAVERKICWECINKHRDELTII